MLRRRSFLFFMYNGKKYVGKAHHRLGMIYKRLHATKKIAKKVKNVLKLKKRKTAKKSKKRKTNRRKSSKNKRKTKRRRK